MLVINPVCPWWASTKSLADWRLWPRFWCWSLQWPQCPSCLQYGIQGHLHYESLSLSMVPNSFLYPPRAYRLICFFWCRDALSFTIIFFLKPLAQWLRLLPLDPNCWTLVCLHHPCVVQFRPLGPVDPLFSANKKLISHCWRKSVRPSALCELFQLIFTWLKVLLWPTFPFSSITEYVTSLVRDYIDVLRMSCLFLFARGILYCIVTLQPWKDMTHKTWTLFNIYFPRTNPS